MKDIVIKKGLVIKSISGEYTIDCDGEIYVCKPRGLFRYQELTIKVGDYVDFNTRTLSIIKIYERKNDLDRPVMANIDKVLLVVSVTNPELNLNLLDKMLSILEYNDIEPILIFSKVDLLENKDEYNIIKNYYTSLDYHIYESTHDGYDLKILQEIDGYVCVLTGQSGVGKTTLLSNIDKNLVLKTDIISKALGRGKHTTRHIELYKIHNGYIADSPGFGSITFEEISPQTLSQTFREFFKYSKECFYPNCTHIKESKCKVLEMLKENKIMKSRYDNYLLFIKEIEKIKKEKY